MWICAFFKSDMNTWVKICVRPLTVMKTSSYGFYSRPLRETNHHPLSLSPSSFLPLFLPSFFLFYFIFSENVLWMLIYILGRPNLRKQHFWSWTDHRYMEVQRISAILQTQWFYQHFISKYFLKHQRIFLSIRTLSAASLGWFLLQVCPKDLYQLLKIIVNLSLRLVYLELCLGMIKGKDTVFQSVLTYTKYLHG